MAEPRVKGRRAGALVPLFSIPSRDSWGIGEIPDLPLFAEWMHDAGLSVVQLLPVNEMGDNQTSPYSALSAMAIDPIYIALREVPEFFAWGGEAALSDEEVDQLEQARTAATVDYATVRALKNRALRGSFDAFYDREWQSGSPRADALRAYMEREGWWLDDYALFRALHAESGGQYWIEWDEGIRTRQPEAIRAARGRLEHEVLYYTWLQMVADEQWERARDDCDALGVAILGDFPFMVSGDSADVWSRQQEFRIDASVGVPPDAFSETGQDWGLPVYRWDVLEAGGYEWMHMRARRCAELYDGFRVDHLVGFYRTFVREKNGETYFVPAEEPAQLAQGERLLDIFRESDAALIAEDLGVVPDFVRQSLERMHVPGMKVMRWEREWEAEGQPFKDPSAYPPLSVAISGTHDTETMAEWWDNAGGEERARVIELPAVVEAAIQIDETYSDRLRDALLTCLYGAGSDLLLMPLQDIFGWTDRINTPAVVSDENWSWRLPWPVDRMRDERDAMERAEFLEHLSRTSRRHP
jgi:4-alpha-glucanotransferase